MPIATTTDQTQAPFKPAVKVDEIRLQRIVDDYLVKLGAPPNPDRFQVMKIQPNGSMYAHDTLMFKRDGTALLLDTILVASDPEVALCELMMTFQFGNPWADMPKFNPVVVTESPDRNDMVGRVVPGTNGDRYFYTPVNGVPMPPAGTVSKAKDGTAVEFTHDAPIPGHPFSGSVCWMRYVPF